ncbi:MAG: iron chaperone [Solirubrobacteraceae bacterium]
MKERVREMKSAQADADGESEVLTKIAEMPDADRVLAERFHAIVRKTTPDLTPRTWYGMPAYSRGDKIVCHFQGASKFKTRYATIGFSTHANLDDGAMWPVGFALTKLTRTTEARIRELLTQAVS